MAHARVAVLVLAACAAAQAPAAAASFALTAQEQAEALRVGEQSVRNEAFGGEWSSSKTLLITPMLGRS